MTTPPPHTPSVLSEQDIRAFLRIAPQPRRLLLRGLLLTTIAASLIVASFVILNLPAYLSIRNVTAEAPGVPSATPVPSVLTATPVPTPEATPSIPQNTVSLERLNVSAPIIWDISLETKVVNRALTDGTVHILGTAKPGQTGAVVIFGHSSNYPWIRGAYNTIFAPLVKAAANDTIEMNYGNRRYLYQVTRVYEVKPTELSVLSATSVPSLRLITCVPLGTSLRRLVVEAAQIVPDPAGNTAFAHSAFSGDLPATR